MIVSGVFGTALLPRHLKFSVEMPVVDAFAFVSSCVLLFTYGTSSTGQALVSTHISLESADLMGTDAPDSPSFKPKHSRLYRVRTIT